MRKLKDERPDPSVLRAFAGQGVVLTMMPFCSVDTPPVGLGLLAAALTERWHAVDVVDLNVELLRSAPEHMHGWWFGQQNANFLDPHRFAALMPELEPLLHAAVESLLELPHRVIGFATYSSNLRFSAEVARRIHELDPWRLILFGGPSARLGGERRWVGPGVVDAWIAGEAEEVLPALLDGEADDHPALTVGRDADLRILVRPAELVDLDAAPFPDFSAFPITLYARCTDGRITVPMVGSRGCIMKCAFCNERTVGPRYRSRSAESIHAEMAHQKWAAGATHVRFNDQLFNGRPRMLMRLCQLLEDRPLDLHWMAQGIARGDMAQSTYDAMYRAGCREINYGIESGSMSALARMGKAVKLLDPLTAMRRTHRAGIRVHINLMVGFPGETEEEFQETLRLVTDARDYIDMVENLHPLFITPGSQLDLHSSAFGIRWPKGEALHRAMYWEGKDGSTYDLRKDRVKRLARHIADQGIAIDPAWLHLYDEKDGLKAPMG